jgi:hypothetical protein
MDIYVFVYTNINFRYLNLYEHKSTIVNTRQSRGPEVCICTYPNECIFVHLYILIHLQ